MLGVDLRVRTRRRKQIVLPEKRIVQTRVKPVAEPLEVRRLLSIAAGGLDTSFGSRGLVAAEFGPSVPDNRSNAAAVLPITSSGGDHDLLVVGNVLVGTNGQAAAALYRSDGTLLDTTLASIPGSTDSSFICEALDGTDSSGNPLVVVGASSLFGSSQDNAMAYRFAIVGTGASQTLQLDSSWGTGGIATINVGARFTTFAIAVDGPDVIGTSVNGVVAYVNNDRGPGGPSLGSPDPSFATNGFELGVGGFGMTINPVGPVIAIDGQLSSQGKLTLLNGNGSLISTTSLGLGKQITYLDAITMAPNGDYVVTGEADGQSVVAELTPDGSLDPSFGIAGQARIKWPNGVTALPKAVAVQSNGKIVVAGYWQDTSFFAARFNANGSLDSGAFGAPNGYVLTSAGGSRSFINGVAIQPDGQIVAAGYSYDGNGTTTNLELARYVYNNAPTAARNSIPLNGVISGSTSPSGTDVHTIVQRLGASDLDGDPLGIAISGIDNSNGAWQFSTDGGNTWNPIDPASRDGNALTLADAPDNLVRFVPNGAFIGSASIALRLWDQTKGSSGTASNITVNKAANYNSFSDNTYSATVYVASNSTVYVDSTWAGSTPGAQVSDPNAWFGASPVTFGINAFATVQEGVGNVASGGIVDVAAGAYSENVVISQPLTFNGANHDVSGAGTRGAETLLKGGNGTALTISVPDVTINGVEAAGNAGISCGAGITILDDFVSTTGTGIAISGSAAGPIVVESNTITGTSGSDAISVRNVQGLTTIRNNQISGASSIGIDLAADSNVSIIGNDIRGHSAQGILIEAGVYGGSGVSVANNFVENNGIGVQIRSGASGPISIIGNSIGGDASYGYAGNTVAGLDNQSAAAVDARLNWWGDASGPGGIGSGSGDKILGANVDFTPWLTNGVDADAPDRADGFQPSPNQPVSITGGRTVTAGEVEAFNHVLLATFMDPTNPAGSLAGNPYTADLSWGDGKVQVDSAQITYDSVHHLFDIWGSHTYAEEGDYTIGIQLHQGAQTYSATSTAEIADQILTNVTANQNLRVKAGPRSKPLLIATFNDLGNPTGDLTEKGEYVVDINWGDGTGTQLNSGLVVYNAKAGLFEVYGFHAYDKQLRKGHGSGLFAVTVTIHHDATNPVTVTGTVTIR